MTVGNKTTSIQDIAKSAIDFFGEMGYSWEDTHKIEELPLRDFTYKRTGHKEQMAKKQEKANQKRISGFRKGADVLQGKQKTGFLKGHWLNVAVLLVLYDLAVVNFSYVTALWLRYDFKFSTIDPS